MIAWRDALSLSRKRWKRKRIFGNLKYSAPLFFLVLLSIVTLNIIYVLCDRVMKAEQDNRFHHPTHLRISVPPKSQDSITPAQMKALRSHAAVSHFMGGQQWLANFFADLGETRYAQIPYFCGYPPAFFNLYRVLPPTKSDPDCVPLLLGRDLLALSWSPGLNSFVRNEKEEEKRWLGRKITVYFNPWGTEVFPSTFSLEQLDYLRYRRGVMAARQQHLIAMTRTNPELARHQDALYMNVQVVGYVRDLSESGRTSVLPVDVAAQLAELSAMRRGKKYKLPAEDGLASVNLLVAQERVHEVAALASSLGLKASDRSNDSIIARLIRTLRDDLGTRLAVYIVSSTYAVVMMIIIYQLLSGQVKDAIREIGLLRCIGARRRDIMRIFVVMNLVRLARIYLAGLAVSYLLLLAGGYWSSGWLNQINPESLAKGNIPEFLIVGIDHFASSWLIAPYWMAVLPLLLLVPIALASAGIPIWHAMGVQPSEALRD